MPRGENMPDDPRYDLPKQTNYETSLAMAREKLSALDLAERARAAGCESGEKGVLLPFIGRRYLVESDSLDMVPQDGGPAPETWEHIIALHYLIEASGKPPSGELITYKQVQDGAPYYPVFLRRTSGILLSVFGGRLPQIRDIALKLGGRDFDGPGDFCVAMPALPRVEYVIVAYEADDEFDPEMRVLMDSTINSYLPAEDITVLCQMLCLKIVKSQ